MHLKLENGESWDDPSSYQIEEALRKLEQTSNSFLILERSSTGYMQAAGDPENGYYLEYRSASADKQYRCSDSNLSLQMAAEILTNYAAKNRHWHTFQEWEETSLSISEGPQNPLFSGTRLLMFAGLAIALATVSFKSRTEQLLNVEINGKEFYILTLAAAMAVPQSIKDLRRWNELGSYMKANSIAILLLFLMGLWASVYTFLE